MRSEIHAALAYMCRRILYPLVRILVRFGVSAGELKSIIDSVYAHAGSEYLAHQGERVTYSRLAVITGISRSVLPAILAAPQEGDFQPRSGTQLHRAARVLIGWHNDRDFQTRGGGPAVLSLHGERRSFEQLTRRYSGGVYFGAILAELERMGAVQRVGRDGVRAMRRTLSTGGASADSLYSAGDLAGDLIRTLDHNLAAATDEQLPVRSLALPADQGNLPLLRAQVRRGADALLSEIESFLQPHRRRGSRELRAGEEHRGLALGATVFAVVREEDRTGKEPSPSPESSTRARRRKV